jgi:hypothetical protein
MKAAFITLTLVLGLSELVLTPASAQNLGIQYSTSTDELRLTASSCEKLRAQHDALCAWKKSIEPDFVIPASSSSVCQKTRTGRFEMREKECLPEFTKKYTDRKLYHHGPNCWGTALSFHGLSPKPRFVWPEEIQYWMESPVCRKLSVGEAPQPGDVVNIYAPEYMSQQDINDQSDIGTRFWEALYPNRYTPVTRSLENGYTGYHRLLHSVTYLSKELTYGKDSPSMEDLFYFHELDDAYGRPGSGTVSGPSSADRRLQENQSLVPYLRENQLPPKDIKSGDHPYFSTAYRCGNINDYLTSRKLSTAQQKMLNETHGLQALQEKLFGLVVTSMPAFAADEVAAMLKKADAIVARNRELLKKKTNTADTQMLLTHEYFTAAGIRKSLEQSKIPTVKNSSSLSGDEIESNQTALSALGAQAVEETYRLILADGTLKSAGYPVAQCRSSAMLRLHEVIQGDAFYLSQVDDTLLNSWVNVVCEKVKVLASVVKTQKPVVTTQVIADQKKAFARFWKSFETLFLIEASTRYDHCRARTYFTQRLRSYCLFNEMTFDEGDQFKKSAWFWMRDRATRQWLKDPEVIAFLKSQSLTEAQSIAVINALTESASEDLGDQIFSQFYAP